MDIWSFIGKVLRDIEKAHDDPVRRIFSPKEIPHLPEHREAGIRAAERILRNAADAEEAVDQAFTEIAQQPSEPPNTRAAVVKKSQQRALDQYRKKQRRRTEANSDTANRLAVSRELTAHEEVEMTEYLGLLEEAIQTLPLDDQPAAYLYFRQGCSVKETGEELHTEYQPVYRSLGRSRPRLHEQLPVEYRQQLRPFPEHPSGRS